MHAQVDDDLVEWNYGQYEGRRTADIHAERPEWQLFRDGCPGGESPDLVAARADCVISRVRSAPSGRAAFFQRPFPARARGPLVRAWTRGWKLPSAEHGESEYAGL